jgi:hypothetical protein
MKKLARKFFNIAGLEVSRLESTIVIPKPRPGPEAFHCTGIDWGQAQVDEFLDSILPKYREEYVSFERKSDDPSVYFSDNSYFGFVDAAVCYSFIRSRVPSTVVEVGSGFSSRLIRAALGRNGSGRLISIDPDPRAPVNGVSHEYHRTNIESMPLSWFTELPADSLLFIDSSHVAGTGSDVNFLFLEVLPLLKPGTLIHVHDIHLPEDYPVSWNIEKKRNYSEQYLLHALLCFSRGFQVLWPGRWVLKNRRPELQRLMPEGEDLDRHCSFWLERTQEK